MHKCEHLGAAPEMFTFTLHLTQSVVSCGCTPHYLWSRGRIKQDVDQVGHTDECAT